MVSTFLNDLGFFKICIYRNPVYVSQQSKHFRMYQASRRATHTKLDARETNRHVSLLNINDMFVCRVFTCKSL